MAREITSKHIEGIADLVVVAPIREGFIDAFENVTYETRLKLVAEALHNIRVSAREHEKLNPFSDTTQRILTLLDFRIGVLDLDVYDLVGPTQPRGAAEPGRAASGAPPQLRSRRYLYLAATFDGAWEPYMRLIWRPLGAFLDLLFCNCDGYVTACDHSFADYAAWVRSAQVDSANFYATTGLTVRDQIYLRELERFQRALDPGDAADLKLAQLTLPEVDTLSDADRASNPALTLQLGLEALTVLYRLADYYPPDRLDVTHDPLGGLRLSGSTYHAEGRYLLRAAQSLLMDWDPASLPDVNPEFAEIKRQSIAHFQEQLGWYRTELGAPGALLGSREVVRPAPAFDPLAVQAGVLAPFKRRVVSGALLLMTIDDAEAARTFIAGLELSYGESDPDGDFFRTIAFTRHGLHNIGMFKSGLDRFPKEFREGMAQRSGLIGDFRDSHPREWILPERNWPQPQPGEAARPPVDMGEIDFVIQLRYAPQGASDTNALHAEISRIAEAAQAGAGGKPAAVLAAYEPLVSHYDDTADGVIREHFGFVDGLSQPQPTMPGASPATTDAVSLGEVLIGHANDRGDHPLQFSDGYVNSPGSVPGLMANGSFLVVRKIAQDVAAFEAYLEAESKRIADVYNITFDKEALAARLMGRARDGTTLASVRLDNGFDYSGDPDGDACPFAAHVRRANPRDRFQGRPAPRMVRRGMSFGPRHTDVPEASRGLVFMAYVASIAEQYEVVQRWLNGGNPTGVGAAQNDPVTGSDPQYGDPNPDGSPGAGRVFRFIVDGKVIRSRIAKPFTRLHWGLYLFVPSKSGMVEICGFKRAVRALEDPKEQTGSRIIEKIKQLPEAVQRAEWKRLIEDFDNKDPAERGRTLDVWSAIRTYEGGVMRVELPGPEPTAAEVALFRSDSPRGVVLVASRRRVAEILANHTTYSVEGQGRRVQDTAGDIYVAQQPGARYHAEADITNTIMFKYDEEWGFNTAYACAKAVLGATVDGHRKLGLPVFEAELRRDFLDPTLAAICNAWFGLPDGTNMLPGSWQWGSPAVARCPGDFIAPSRHAFYPSPTLAVTAYAREHGQRIHAAGQAFAAHHALNPAATPGVLSNAMAQKITDPELLGRNIIGMMIGALPPLDGNLRGILHEWFVERTLWRHQAALLRAQASGMSAFDAASAALLGPIERAICKRPSPDLLYRTATHDDTLEVRDGELVEVKAGDLVILGLVSATQRSLQDDDSPINGSPYFAFGGDRPKAVVDEVVDSGEPIHACPAQKMMMGAMMGITAALLEVGRIQALPASLIVRVSAFR